ncbi:Phage tail protein OS=Streptomyces microflavus OX=1919 GN=Smic_81170 PE=4 SV=1 [Streptomyces microflavus]
MPTTDGYGQKVPYPVMSDAPNIELAFQGAVNALTKQTVLRFANANERSAMLMGAFAAVPGMLSYLIAEDRWDQFDGDGVWRPLTPEHGSPSRSHRVTPHSAAAPDTAL